MIDHEVPKALSHLPYGVSHMTLDTFVNIRIVITQ